MPAPKVASCASRSRSMNCVRRDRLIVETGCVAFWRGQMTDHAGAAAVGNDCRGAAPGMIAATRALARRFRERRRRRARCRPCRSAISASRAGSGRVRSAGASPPRCRPAGAAAGGWARYCGRLPPGSHPEMAATGRCAAAETPAPPRQRELDAVIAPPVPASHLWSCPAFGIDILRRWSPATRIPIRLRMVAYLKGRKQPCQ